MSYTHLNAFERGRVQALHEEGKSMHAIATTLGRHHSTISRELRRNSRSNDYDAQKAHDLYRTRRKQCRPAHKIAYLPLWNYVFEYVPEGHTPEEIAGRLPMEYPDDPRMRISHEALYQALYREEQLHCLIPYLPQSRPRRRKRGQGKTRRGPSIPNRVGIEQRPQAANERSRYGDWEGDIVVGSHHQGFLVTLVDRKSRLTKIMKTDTKTAEEVSQATIEALLDMPVSWVKTITFDNGTEFAQHEKIAQGLLAKIYFAQPYASYQRGTNENTNGLIRRFLPKGTDFRKITQKQIDAICESLNNRPRKVLNYRTPNEVFEECQRKKLVALGA
jgi:transposase, IS30 family